MMFQSVSPNSTVAAFRMHNRGFNVANEASVRLEKCIYWLNDDGCDCEQKLTKKVCILLEQLHHQQSSKTLEITTYKSEYTLVLKCNV